MLFRSLITENGLEVVQAYMAHIQSNAEAAVRQMLKEFSLAQVCPTLFTIKLNFRFALPAFYYSFGAICVYIFFIFRGKVLNTCFP